ncbi:hypothetical protein Pint_36218 [Pistacia integerrima]|uniref:Uncharacterized protein n=1 Tax=Pistacia integerrima TaxID=434235 RepID=A0ACC0Y295_9ROSI|nr:hypothetical protein Pint_36218 [Pistacia integerrima]
MSRQVLLRSPSVNRRQPLLHKSKTEAAAATTRSSSFAEVAGGTAGKCAAVCCCCPCGLVNLLVLAIYKVPAGLCKKRLKRSRKNGLLKKDFCRLVKKTNVNAAVHPVQNFSEVIKSEEAEKELMKLEKEMWERFYSTGFWRSTSQREALAEK